MPVIISILINCRIWCYHVTSDNKLTGPHAMSERHCSLHKLAKCDEANHKRWHNDTWHNDIFRRSPTTREHQLRRPLWPALSNGSCIIRVTSTNDDTANRTANKRRHLRIQQVADFPTRLRCWIGCISTIARLWRAIWVLNDPTQLLEVRHDAEQPERSEGR